jgi:hypothetical protein
MEVIAGGLHGLSRGEAEVEGGVRLVGLLVGAEAGVAIDAQERAARRPRVDDDVGADGAQLRRERLDEGE